jgi:RNA polymerase sigma factor (sigma-70 family)
MSEKQFTDLQILDRFRQPDGREEAFVWLMEAYQQRLYWHVRKLVLHHEDTDDVLQNTFMKVWKALDNFRGESQLYTWLYRIATNEALTHLAQHKRRLTTAIDDEDTGLAGRLRADRYFDGSDITIHMQEAIAALPDKQRVVFTMRYYDETPYEQMSEILETSVGALKASYHHAAKKVEAFMLKHLNQS